MYIYIKYNILYILYKAYIIGIKCKLFFFLNSIIYKSMHAQNILGRYKYKFGDI